MHNAHGTRIFKDSGATCIFLMRLVVVGVVGLLEMLVQQQLSGMGIASSCLP